MAKSAAVSLAIPHPPCLCRRRIARGSGRSEEQVSELIAMFTSMRAQMQTLSRMMALSGGAQGGWAPGHSVAHALAEAGHRLATAAIGWPLLPPALRGRDLSGALAYAAAILLPCPELQAWLACPRCLTRR